MLNLVLREIASANEPLSLTTLSARLRIEPGALEGMLNYWARKGRLKEDNLRAQKDGTEGCGPACCRASDCSFTAKMPRSYSLTARKRNHGRPVS